MTRVVWTLRAVQNVEAIRDHIAGNSPRYAALHAERLFQAADRLRQFPETGRMVPELQRPDIREVIVGSYRVVYLVGSGVVHVLTVFHGARLYPLATDAVEQANAAVERAHVAPSARARSQLICDPLYRAQHEGDHIPQTTQRSVTVHRLLARASACGILLWLTVACGGTSEPAFPHGEALDSLGAAALIDGPIVGLSIAVAQGGRVVYERGFGLADIASGERASSSTVYNIASTAKILAAVAVMNLVESGRINLDDSLGALLPDVPNRGVIGDITLRQLLNMTSGLSDYVAADLERLAADPHVPLSSEFVLDFVRTAPVTHQPGTNWIYTNTGFYLAGLVVERVTGREWADFMIEEIVRPLGLLETHLCDDVVDSRARGYERVEDGFIPSALDAERGVRGDAGICASVRDLALLPKALADGSVISSVGLEAMTEPTALGKDLVVDYGLGVSRGEISGHRLWGHLGGSGSIVSTLAHYPDDKVTVAVLVNTRRANFGALALEGEVARIVFGLEPSIANLAVDSSTASALVGTYTGDRDATRLQITYDGESLIRVSADEARLHLLRQDTDSFGRADWPFDRIVFQRVHGRAEAYSAYYNGFFDGYYRRVE